MELSRRKLYVHVGPMKTGTTAVQYYLRKHDESVLMYPKVGLYAGAHHGLVFNFFKSRRARRAGIADVDELFEQVARCTRNRDIDVLISSESLAPMAWNEPVDVGSFIRALVPHIGTNAPEVEILIACREHFSWAASTYNQSLKGGSEQRDPDEYLRTYAARLCFAPTLRGLRNTGFNVTALNYHPSESWVERFLTHVGFPRHLIPRAQTKNISLSSAGLIAKLASNRVERNAEKKRQLRGKLKKTPEFGAPSQFIFGSGVSEEAERLFAEDRASLSQEFGIELPVPRLDSPNMFFIQTEDLARIKELVRSLGIDGDAVVENARQYVRA